MRGISLCRIVRCLKNARGRRLYWHQSAEFVVVKEYGLSSIQKNDLFRVKHVQEGGDLRHVLAVGHAGLAVDLTLGRGSASHCKRSSSSRRQRNAGLGINVFLSRLISQYKSDKA